MMVCFAWLEFGLCFRSCYGRWLLDGCFGSTIWCAFSCCLIRYLLSLCMVVLGFEFMVNSVGHFRALVFGFRWLVCLVAGFECNCLFCGCECCLCLWLWLFWFVLLWLVCGCCGCWCLAGRIVVTCVCWLLSVVYVGVRDFFLVGVLWLVVVGVVLVDCMVVMICCLLDRLLTLVVAGGCYLLSVVLLWFYWFGCLDVLVFLVCVG